MNRRSFILTKIKRGQLVLQLGVGSVVRTRQGVTALVAGLPEWEHSLLNFCQGDPAERVRYIVKHRFKEPELQNATGARWFVPPPAEGDRSSWEIPLLRFPLAGICTNWQCQRVSHGSHGTPAGRAWWCNHCSGKRASRVNQVPIFYACPAGHLAEIDFDAVIDHAPGCERPLAKVNMRDQLERPAVSCASCGGKGTLEDQPCDGGRPWLPTATAEQCSHSMEVVARTSIKAYYANTKSAIHIPLEAGLDEELLRYLEAANWDLIAFSTPEERQSAAQRLVDEGWQISIESAIDHIQHVRSGTEDDSEQEWDILIAREREYDVLAGRRRYPALESSPLLTVEDHPLNNYANPLVEAGWITHITAVHNLTETRVLNGFARITPNLISARDGRQLMWGRDITEDGWLPGYRTHGEGIFLEFDASRLGPQGASHDLTGGQAFKLSTAGTIVHTFAHALIVRIAESAGYPVPSIRDRLYDIGGGRLGVLVYAAEGDAGGTLGGLVAHVDPSLFDPLVTGTLEALGWCPQDPVCLETKLDAERGIGAACHQCVLLPETSCELFNAFLDRSAVVGSLI